MKIPLFLKLYSGSQTATLSLMYFGYMCLLINRANISYLIPALIDADVLTAETASYLLAIGNAAYLMGKLTTGRVVDFLGGRRGFLFAICGSAVFSLLFAIPVPSIAFWYLVICWCINKFFQSAGWPSLAHLIRNWMSADLYGRTWGIVSTSSRFGSLSATFLVSALLLEGVNWRVIIVICAIILSVACVFNFFLLRAKPLDAPSSTGQLEELEELEEVVLFPQKNRATDPAIAGKEGADAACDDDNDPQTAKEEGSLESEVAAPAQTVHKPTPVLVLLSRFWGDPRFIWICLSVATLDLVLEFESFLALFLRSWLGLSAGQAALMSASFPFGAFLSVVIGGFLMDKMQSQQQAMDKCLTITLSALTVSSLLLGVVYLLSQDGSSAFVVFLTIVLLLCMGFALGFPCYLPMNLYGLSVGKEECGILVSLIDSCGYTAAIAFDYVAGFLARDENWAALLFIVFVFSALGTLATHLYMKKEIQIAKAANSAAHPEELSDLPSKALES
eukprot:ANDGO_04043.mRNA.1 putative hexose phosphate transport protein